MAGVNPALTRCPDLDCPSTGVEVGRCAGFPFLSCFECANPNHQKKTWFVCNTCSRARNLWETDEKLELSQDVLRSLTKHVRNCNHSDSCSVADLTPNLRELVQMLKKPSGGPPPPKRPRSLLDPEKPSGGHHPSMEHTQSSTYSSSTNFDEVANYDSSMFLFDDNETLLSFSDDDDGIGSVAAEAIIEGEETDSVCNNKDEMREHYITMNFLEKLITSEQELALQKISSSQRRPAVVSVLTTPRAENPVAELDDMADAQNAQNAVGNMPVVPQPVVLATDNDNHGMPLGAISHEFLRHEISKYGGMRYLIQKACHKQHWNEPHNQLSDGEVEQLYRLLKLVWTLTRSQNEQLIKLLAMWGEPRREESRVPDKLLEYKDLRRIFIDGRNSIMNHLPKPPVERVGAHAYVPIIDSIAHLLAFERHSFDTVSKEDAEWFREHGKPRYPVTRLGQCEWALRTFDDKVDIHLLMMTWSDGFDGNYSSKQNRFNPWIKTATVIIREDSPVDKCSLRWKSSMPVAIGPGTADTTLLEERFYNDMRFLDRPGGNRFFVGSHGSHGGCLSVRVSIVVVRGDQPERRKLCGITGINSNNGPAFGVIGNFKECSKNVPSCDSCLEKLVNHRTVVRDCAKCLNWEYFREDTDLNRYQPTGKDGINFPNEEMDDDGKLGIRKMSFEAMQGAADKAHESVVREEWTIQRAKAYLTCMAFNQHVIDEILNHASRVLAWNNAVQQKEEKPELYAEFKKFHDRNPSRYQKFKLPPIVGTDHSLEQVIDLIMHLLFLGIGKHVFDDSKDYLASRKMLASFVRYAQGLLESLSDLCDWCKPKPFEQGTGGSWVSEDYLAFVKLMPWFYSSLAFVHPSKNKVAAEIDMPDDDTFDLNAKKGAGGWLKPVCTQWLKLRGLPHDKMTPNHKMTLKEQGDVIRSHMVALKEKGTPLPPIVNVVKKGKQPSTAQMNAVFQSLYVMVARIMAKRVYEKDIEETDIAIRIFLSYYSRYESMRASSKTKEKTPRWISCGNFLSLPRIPRSMKLFGPLRNTWEGGYGGEGTLVEVKPILRGARKNWQNQCLKRLLTSRSLSIFDYETREGKYKHHKVYESETEAFTVFQLNRPLSGFVTVDNTYMIALSDERFVIVNRSKFHGKINSWEYHVWNWDAVATGIAPAVADYVLFLPQLGEEGFMSEKGVGIYAVTNEDWQVLNSHGKFETPSCDPWPVDEEDADEEDEDS